MDMIYKYIMRAYSAMHVRTRAQPYGTIRSIKPP